MNHSRLMFSGMMIGFSSLCLIFYVSTKSRVDHAATRFQLPDCTGLDTNNKFVPPLFVIQIQIPSEPPPSFFSTVEDGPGQF
jgi:hypothetical protein